MNIGLFRLLINVAVLLIKLNNVGTFVHGECLLPRFSSPIIVVGGEWKSYENGTTKHVVQDMDHLVFDCPLGYDLDGQKRVTCFGDRFISRLPSCHYNSCPHPEEPKNGFYHKRQMEPRDVRKEIYPLGSVLLAECNKGFRLAPYSSAQVFCKINSTRLYWKGETPKCEKVLQCGDPGVSTDGSRVGESFSAGDRIIYSCKDGFELHGEKSITCLQDGKWDFDKPKCKPKLICSNPSVRNGLISSWTKKGDFFEPGDEAQLVCAEGFHLFGGTGRAHCLMIDFAVESFEVDDNELSSDMMSKPFWDEPLGKCKEIICETPASPDYGYFKNHSQRLGHRSKESDRFFPYDFKIEYACQNDYRIIGRRYSRCTSNGWSLTSLPLCKKMKCATLQAPENGWVSSENLTQPNVGVLFGCSKGYKLIGSERRKCLKTGRWSGIISRCVKDGFDDSGCGVINGRNQGHGRIFGGEKVEHHWPWMAALHLRYPLNRNKSFEFKCGGSLISSRYVLTAAHCLRGRHHDLIEEDVIVELGHTSVLDKSHAIKLQAAELIIHEKFGKTPFDSDLALIKLNQSVQFTAFLNPVCLPPPSQHINSDSILYKPNEEGTALGYGTYLPKSRKMYDNLRQVTLKIRTRTVCAESLINSTLKMTSNMFCAGGDHGMDTCMGDSGGPMMQNPNPNDEIQRWIQVGIVSWAKSEKCGADFEYGYYTKISEFIGWIKNNLV